jgi:hypothetical protein
MRCPGYKAWDGDCRLAWSIANSSLVSKRLVCSSAAEEEIFELPDSMRCMPDEAILKHNRDANCLERQTSAMFDVNCIETLLYKRYSTVSGVGEATLSKDIIHRVWSCWRRKVQSNPSIVHCHCPIRHSADASV